MITTQRITSEPSWGEEESHNLPPLAGSSFPWWLGLHTHIYGGNTFRQLQEALGENRTLHLISGRKAISVCFSQLTLTGCLITAFNPRLEKVARYGRHSFTLSTHTEPSYPRFYAGCHGVAGITGTPSIKGTEKNTDGSIYHFRGGNHRRSLSVQVPDPP